MNIAKAEADKNPRRTPRRFHMERYLVRLLRARKGRTRLIDLEAGRVVSQEEFERKWLR
jgi:hypothetical protein